MLTNERRLNAAQEHVSNVTFFNASSFPIPRHHRQSPPAWHKLKKAWRGYAFKVFSLYSTDLDEV
jgi:hypothetical protein